VVSRDLAMVTTRVQIPASASLCFYLMTWWQ